VVATSDSVATSRQLPWSLALKRHLAALCLAASLVAALPFGLSRSSAAAAVSELTVSQTCSTAIPGTVRVTFTWSGAAPGSPQTWVDLSLFNNGWQAGTFLGAGPLASTNTSFTWDGLLSNTEHYARVNQQLPVGNWDPSATFTFATMACPQAAYGQSMPASPVQGTSGGTIDIVVTAGSVVEPAPSGSGIIIVTLP
jgi:hypothetical protein